MHTLTRVGQKYPLLEYFMQHGARAITPQERELSIVRATLVEASAAFCPKAHLYLSTNLHDSAIIGTSCSLQHVSFTLCDDGLGEFYSALCNKFAVPESESIIRFPVTLRFTGLTRFAINIVTPSDELVPVKAERYLRRLGELLYDEVLRFEPGHIALGMYCLSKKRRSSARLLVEIEAQELVVEESFHMMFQKAFGEDVTPLVMGYLEKRKRGGCNGFRAIMDYLGR